MNHSNKVSEAQINAYIDGELHHSDKSIVIDAISKDEDLAQMVSEYRHDMELLRLAYDSPPKADRGHRLVPVSESRKKYVPVLAASLLLLIGTLTGLLISKHDKNVITPAFTAISDYQPASADNKKILIHVNSFDNSRIIQALNKAEEILDYSKQTNRNIQLSLVANQAGLGMLREGSPYADRIHRLSTENGNVRFLACGIAMEMTRLQEGADVKLLPDAEKIPAALSEILDKIKAGWLYVKS